ncbi:purine-nucleoside phosphorylase, partial [Hymenobacter persicinus]
MQDFHEATAHIRQQIGDFQPEFGIILGTGLGDLVQDIDVQFTLPYAG